MKGGEHLTVAFVRVLRGAMEREKASIGVLITMHNPTHPMTTEATEAGFYRSPMWRDKKYPRLQVLTIPELLAGKQIEMPPTKQVNVTFKKAPKVPPDGGKSPEGPGLFDKGGKKRKAKKEAGDGSEE